MLIDVNTEFDPGIGNEYHANLYPGLGIYYIPRINNTYIIAENTGGQYVVTTIMGFKPKEYTPPKEANKPLEDLATILAVSLHADAAKAYINGTN